MRFHMGRINEELKLCKERKEKERNLQVRDSSVRVTEPEFQVPLILELKTLSFPHLTNSVFNKPTLWNTTQEYKYATCFFYLNTGSITTFQMQLCRSKLPLNDLMIDQLEKPSSIQTRSGNRDDSLWVKQGGVVCNMGILSLWKRSSIIRGLYCFCIPPSIFHLY